MIADKSLPERQSHAPTSARAVWVWKCLKSEHIVALLTSSPACAHSCSAFLSQPRWGLQVQSSITGVSPFGPRPDNKAWVGSDRECVCVREREKVRGRENVTHNSKALGKCPFEYEPTSGGQNSSERKTLLRFSPVFFLFGAAILVFVRKQISIYTQRESKDDTDTQSFLSPVFLFLATHPSLFCVSEQRRVGWPSVQRQGLRQRYSSGQRKGERNPLKTESRREWRCIIRGDISERAWGGGAVLNAGCGCSPPGWMNIAVRCNRPSRVFS